MIFSEIKWENGRELQKVIRSSSEVDFNSMESLLREAYELFIFPVLGDDMITRLEQEYLEDESGDNRLVYLAQRSNANLAVWYNFYELTVILSGSGIQKAEIGEYKGLYKYQERALKDNYKQKGFNALDDVLIYLENNVDKYPEFKKSPAYQFRKTSIVPGANVVQKYLPIENSRILFLRLQPHITFLEKTKLPSLMGNSVYEKLLSALNSELMTEDMTGLLELVRPVIILLSASRLIRQSGTLTDKGLYYASVSATNGNDVNFQSAEQTEISMLAKSYENDASEYLTLLDNYIKEKFPDDFRGRDSDKFDIDNKNRKIFYAI